MKTLLCASLLALALAPACSQRIDTSSTEDAGSVDPTPSIYDDIPTAPLIDQSNTNGPPLPPNIGDLFGAADQGAMTGGPCVLEPQDGALYPMNWLRLRFRVASPAGQNVFELRLSIPNQHSELRVYTNNPTYALPAPLWAALAQHSLDRPIRYSVRGAVLAGAALMGPPALGAAGTLSIAPVKAEGSIVYWTTAQGTGFKGFKIGDEKVKLVYDPPKAGTGCVGCHASTPDGEFVAFSAAANPQDGSDSRQDLRSADGTGQQPPWLSAAARGLLDRRPQHGPSFSRALWAPGRRILFSMLPVNNRWEAIWTDLESPVADQGKGWGVIARGGDARQAGAAMISHDGSRLVYVSGSDTGIGMAQSDGDVALVPFNNGQGGPSTPLGGASDPAWNEYYPVFSPDDALIAFNRAPKGASSVNNPQAEVFVVPTAGGAPLRLLANDPPQCGGKKSPGITNSWPRWAPEAGRAGGRRYYFLTFSSTRAESGTPQLYTAPVVIDENGTISSYPALPLWNQPATEGNHTPAWDVFRLVLE